MIVPIALIAMTDTRLPRVSNGISFLRVYDDLIAIRSPGLMDRTRSKCLSSEPFSQMPSFRKRGIWSSVPPLYAALTNQ